MAKTNELVNALNNEFNNLKAYADEVRSSNMNIDGIS